jgi:Ca2+-binding EF-hand superfamily protein
MRATPTSQASPMWKVGRRPTVRDLHAMESIISHLSELKDLFNIFDVDKSGTIDVHELSQAFERLLNCPLTSQNAQLMVKRVDIDQSGTIDFEEFTQLTSIVIPMKKQFDEVDRDGSHSLDTQELNNLLQNPPNNYTFSSTDIDSFIRMFDDDQNGEIGYQEYFNLALYLRELEYIFNQWVEDSQSPHGPRSWSHYLLSALGSTLAHDQRVLNVFSKLKPDINFEIFAVYVIRLWSVRMANMTQSERDKTLKVTKIRTRRPPRTLLPLHARSGVRAELKKEKLRAEQELTKIWAHQKGKWIDPDFPADDSVIPLNLRGGRCVWLRPCEIVQKNGLGKNANLFVDGSEDGDVMQGMLGDCWFLSALSLLATTEGMVNELFVNECPERGVYRLRFYKDCEWHYIDIDDRLPCHANTNQLLFASCRDPTEFWVPLVEKAYAKLHGSYSALENGVIVHALRDFTGEGTEMLDPDNPADLIFKDKKKLWETLLDYKSESFLMGCSMSVPDIETESANANGLLYNHAYGIIDVQFVQGHCLVRIRNPWGRQEWNGRWSDGSNEWTPQLKRHFDFEFGDDGTFFMCFDDFYENFNKIHVLRLLTDDVGEKWSKHSFKDQWTQPNRCGGCPNAATFLKNPQYLIHTSQRSRIFISLSQLCMRYALRTQKLSRNQQQQYNPIGMIILQHTDMRNRKYSFAFSDIIAKTMYSRNRDQWIEFIAEPNTPYILVPSTLDQGQLGVFELTVYVQCGNHVVVPLTEEPKCLSIEGEWKGHTAGGCLNHSTWIYNPQYALTWNRSNEKISGSLVVMLEQLGQRAEDSIGVIIFSGTGEGDITRRVLPQSVRQKSEWINRKRVTTEIHINDLCSEMPLIIVPCTFTCGIERPFHLEVVFLSENPSQHHPSLELKSAAEYYSYQNIPGAWKLPNMCGGCSNNPSTWFQNPFYSLHIKNTTGSGTEKAKLVLTLGAVKTEQRIPCGFHVFERAMPGKGQGKNGLAGIMISSSQYSSSPVLELVLDCGEYMILPSTFYPDVASLFILSVFSNTHHVSLESVV